jgi:TPR repeat protein
MLPITILWQRDPLTQGLLAGEGTEKRLSEAVRWFKLAADGGNDRAQYSLALSYQKGIGVEKDVQKAVRSF